MRPALAAGFKKRLLVAGQTHLPSAHIIAQPVRPVTMDFMACAACYVAPPIKRVLHRNAVLSRRNKATGVAILHGG